MLADIIRGRVSKQVTNGSKTAVMDVVVFLYVSLGSRTVQLHDSLGSSRACSCSEAGFNSRNGDRAWGVCCRRATFCCAFLWAKGLRAKDIHKEMFPVYVCHVKRFTTASRNVANVSLMTRSLKRRCGSGWDKSQKTSMLRVSTHW
jgi:hypothetical protein